MRKATIGIVAVAAMIGTPVFAADMAVKAPPPAPTPSWSWTGFYVGGNGGYGWRDSTVTFGPNDFTAFQVTCGGLAGSTCPPPSSFGISGGLGGLQAGYNWQTAQRWLVGLEADFDWSRIQGTGTSNFLIMPNILPPGTSNFTASETIRWFSTARARVGYLPVTNLLVYATGGLAWGGVQQNMALNNVGLANQGNNPGNSFNCGFGGVGTGPNCFLGSASRTATGWTAGVGLEYALWNNVSLKGEYLFVNLGSGHAVNVVAQAAIPGFGGPSSFTAAYSTVAFNVVRAGLNWKF